MTETEDLLREQVRDLTTRLSIATGQHLAGAIKLATGVENRAARLMAMLYTCPGVVSVESLYREVMADPATGDGPDSTVIKVHLCRARKVLKVQGAPAGLTFVDRLGYRMLPDLRSWLSDRLEAAQ